MRRPSSTATTRTVTLAPYVSHSQRSSAPGTIGPLLLLYQNRVVTAGSANAWNTVVAGLRTIMQA
ncbi:hypothetical protein ACFWP3_02895 [Streptomyces sp. NPDC058525]|uniref:hypothetical protein n=1 Tax=Streptomyces sp. NPDC058525 TaxID=3346538 RepID=UPI00364C9ADD